ncbi:MAG: hypothetical protein JKX81_17215 [Arenicella sp.]|nr:hypothetical protein [Arenicella sp.]
MKSTNENETHIFAEVDYQREVVPSTRSLQASILESAKRTPQYSAAEKLYPVLAASPRRFFLWPPSLLQSTVMAAFVLIFSVGLFLIGVGDQHLGIDTDQKIAFDAFSENDLDWQELMLIDDELLFDQL